MGALRKDDNDYHHSLDIANKWHEYIDEEKLDRLAYESWNNLRKFASAQHIVDGWNNYIYGLNLVIVKQWRKTDEKYFILANLEEAQ